jgi:hypothetical protein
LLGVVPVVVMAATLGIWLLLVAGRPPDPAAFILLLAGFMVSIFLANLVPQLDQTGAEGSTMEWLMC